MSKYIQNLIQKGENKHLDFKFQINDSRKIAKSLVAIANTDGGILLVGVKDNGNIAGIRSDEEFYMVQAAADLYSKPKIMFETVQHKIENKIILEIIIKKGTEYPYSAKNDQNKWLAYIRQNDQNLLVNKIQLMYWKAIKKNESVFIKYTEKESILFNYLNMYGEISLSKYCRIAHLPRYIAEKKITDLLLINALNINYKSNNLITYSIDKNLDVEQLIYGQNIK